MRSSNFEKKFKIFRDIYVCIEKEVICKTGLGIKHFQQLSFFISRFSGVILTVTLVERALLVKRYLVCFRVEGGKMISILVKHKEATV